MTTSSKLSDIILEAQSILLTTHREPDGDGLGSQLALYYALKKINKKVKIVNVDSAPAKYNFLNHKSLIEVFNGVLEPVDLAIVMDTNDRRLISPLYEHLEKNSTQIVFLDHHPVLQKGPAPSPNSIINTKAASTGEITYDLIEHLKIPLNTQISEALYTSLVFDTQMFRFIRNSSKSHYIAAELLKFPINSEKIHQALFGDFSKEKILFMAKSLSHLEFYTQDRIALLRIEKKELLDANLSKDQTKDLIDMIMNIESVEIASLILEHSPSEFKLSFRSKGQVPILHIAESFGGGGHLYAAGAFVQNKNFHSLKEEVTNQLLETLDKYGTKTTA